MLTRDLRRKPGRRRPPIAGAHGLEPRQEVARQRLNVADPMRVQKRLDAIGVGGAFLEQSLAFAVRALVVLLSRARHIHDAAGLGLAAKVGEKGAHQPLEVDAVGLGPARPTIDLDAGRIDLVARDALAFEPAVQPVSLEARFVAGQDPHRQAGLARLGADRGEPGGGRRKVASLDREAAHLLCAGKNDPELPIGLAQFPGDMHRGILTRGGRVRANEIRHLGPPRLDGWQSNPNLSTARRPIVSEAPFATSKGPRRTLASRPSRPPASQEAPQDEVFGVVRTKSGR
jgi:hypothetical protein